MSKSIQDFAKVIVSQSRFAFFYQPNSNQQQWSEAVYNCSVCTVYITRNFIFSLTLALYLTSFVRILLNQLAACFKATECRESIILFLTQFRCFCFTNKFL